VKGRTEQKTGFAGWRKVELSSGQVFAGWRKIELSDGQVFAAWRKREHYLAEFMK